MKELAQTFQEEVGHLIGLQESEVQVLHSADGKIKDRDLNAFNVVISYKNLSTLNLEISMFKKKITGEFIHIKS